MDSWQGVSSRERAGGFAWDPPPRSVFHLPFVGACWRQLQRGVVGRNHGTEGPAIRVYTDAPTSPCAPGGFFMGVWSSEGPVIRRCHQRISNLQSAESFRVLCVLGVARCSGCRHVDLAMDNLGAIA